MLTNLFFILLACLAVSIVVTFVFYLLNENIYSDFFELATLLFAGLSAVIACVAAVVGLILLIQIFIIGTVGGIIALF